MFRNSGKIAKFIVSLAGTVSMGLEAFYGTSAHWVPIVTGAITALTVYLVPNQTQ